MLLTPFWKTTLITYFEASLLRGKNHALFVDLNEMHLLTKVHAEQRSLRGSKVKKSDNFRHFERMDFAENLKNNTSHGSVRRIW